MSDKAKHLASRALACRIANACELSSIGDVLADLVLDRTDDLHLRELAASILSHLSNDEAKKRLVPVATSLEFPSLHSPALEMLGPRLLGAEVFFENISPTFLDASLRYTILTEQFWDGLDGKDIIVGLNWIASHAPYPIQGFTSSRFKSRLLLKGCSHTEDADVVVALVKALRSLQQSHSEFFDGLESKKHTSPLKTPKIRRLLFAELAKQLEAKEITHWLYGDESILLDDDLIWTIELLDSELSENEHRVVASAVGSLVNLHSSPDITNAVLERAGRSARLRDDILAEQVAWLTEPIDHKSEVATEMKQRYRDNLARKQMYAEQREARRFPKPPREYVLQHLEACERGDLLAWPELTYALTFKEDGSSSFPNEPDELPGWQEADESVRLRISTAALQYLECAPTPSNDTLLQRTQTVVDRAGGFALAVMAVAEKLSALSDEVWARWSLAVITHNFRHDLSERLFRLARNANAVVFDDAVMKALHKSAADGHTALLHELIPVWHPSLQRQIVGVMGEGSWPFAYRLQAAEFLINRQVDEVVELAKDWLRSEEDSVARLAIARILIESAPDKSWDVIENVLTGDADFARNVMLGIGDAFRNDERISHRLNGQQLGWMYDHLVALFPRAEDPEITDVPYSPSPRQQMSSFRDGLLYRLASIGTAESIREIERICAAHDKPWMIRLRADAYQELWRRERSHISFLNALSLLADETTTVVRTSAELMDAVEQALKRFEHEAQQGSPPLAVFLWNEGTRKHFSEQRLSDFLAFYLSREWRGRRTILNREVEIRNLNQTGVGERVDLLIQAVSPDDSPNVNHPCVVIEVKCDSNVKLEDIPEQLVGKYLDGVARAYGIYLVGWFGTSKKSAKGELEERSSKIAQQVSVGGVKVSALVLNLVHPKLE